MVAEVQKLAAVPYAVPSVECLAAAGSRGQRGTPVPSRQRRGYAGTPLPAAARITAALPLNTEHRCPYATRSARGMPLS